MAEAERKIEEFPIKLTIERSNLLKSLSRLQTIVEKRNTIMILANIKIEALDNSVRLTATDMDIVATEVIEAAVELQGVLTIPAQTLYDIVRKLPDGSQIELESDCASGQVILSSGSSQFTLSYLPADDFPVTSDDDMTHNFKIATQDFLTLLEKSRFAMSTEETRYYLNGVYLHAAENEDGTSALRAVATDGHRLAKVEIELPDGAKDMPSIIIPRKTVNELTKLLVDQVEEIEIALSDSKIRITAGNIIILSKLVDGTFPDYGRVIPDGNNKIMEVDVRTLSQAVDRVSIISSDKTKGIKFNLSKGMLTLSAQSQESGSAVEELEVIYDADEVEIGFNSRYTLDMLGQLQGDSVQFLFSESTSPAIVSDPADVSALYVIMPMRV